MKVRRIREGFVKEMELGLGLIHIQFADRQTDTVRNKDWSNNQMGTDHLFVVFLLLLLIHSTNIY